MQRPMPVLGRQPPAAPGTYEIKAVWSDAEVNLSLVGCAEEHSAATKTTRDMISSSTQRSARSSSISLRVWSSGPYYKMTYTVYRYGTGIQ